MKLYTLTCRFTSHCFLPSPLAWTSFYATLLLLLRYVWLVKDSGCGEVSKHVPTPFTCATSFQRKSGTCEKLSRNDTVEHSHNDDTQRLGSAPSASQSFYLYWHTPLILPACKLGLKPGLVKNHLSLLLELIASLLHVLLQNASNI